MLYRKLGRTGLDISLLSFGCGAVGGLLVRGDAADQERAVARAVERGITYFDTAPQYGDGRSERSLGRVLARIRPDVQVGTKVRVPESEYHRIGEFIARSAEASLARLGLDSLDLYQLHNRIAATTHADALAVERVLDEVVPAFDRLRRAGKIRFTGITALGETAALQRVVDAGAFDVAQVCFNALNPSADQGSAIAPAGQDYGGLLRRAAVGGMGAIAIRVLAGGALSGRQERHPISMAKVAPIGSGPSYEDDVAAARRLAPLLEAGFAGSLTELALRFVASCPALSTMLIGLATPEELEAAVDAVEKGPLPAEALAHVRAMAAQAPGGGRS
jgi:L-galactose dehydrogenase/L-glyceraldehyde 3-phosphate reductase